MASMPTKADIFAWANAQVPYTVKRMRIEKASSSQPDLPHIVSSPFENLVKGHRYLITARSSVIAKTEHGDPIRHKDQFIIKVNRNGRIVRD